MLRGWFVVGLIAGARGVSTWVLRFGFCFWWRAASSSSPRAFLVAAAHDEGCAMVGECKWMLYTYPLPDAYRRHTRDVSTRRGARLPVQRHEGNAIPIELAATSQRSLGEIYFERARTHPCRTSEAADATLFFVPAYDTEAHGAKERNLWCAERVATGVNTTFYFNALYDRMRTSAGFDALQRRGGADHLFIDPLIGASGYETQPHCELDLEDPRLGAAAKLAIEQEVTSTSAGSPTVPAYLSDRVCALCSSRILIVACATLCMVCSTGAIQREP